jgi:hypothetical protein
MTRPLFTYIQVNKGRASMIRKTSAFVITAAFCLLNASHLAAKCTTDQYDTESSRLASSRVDYERSRFWASLVGVGAAASAGGCGWCWKSFADNYSNGWSAWAGQETGGILLGITAIILGGTTIGVTCDARQTRSTYMHHYRSWNAAREDVKDMCQPMPAGPLLDNWVRRHEQLVRSDPTFHLDILDYVFNLFIFGDEKEELCPEGNFMSAGDIAVWVREKSEITIADFLSLSENYQPAAFPETIKTQYAFFFDLKPQAQDIYAALRNLIAVEQEFHVAELQEKNLTNELMKANNEIRILETKYRELLARSGEGEASRPEGESNPEASLEGAMEKARANLKDLEQRSAECRTLIGRIQTTLQEAIARRTATYEAFSTKASTFHTRGADREPMARFEEELAAKYKRRVGAADASGMGPDVVIGVDIK